MSLICFSRSRKIFLNSIFSTQFSIEEKNEKNSFQYEKEKMIFYGIGKNKNDEIIWIVEKVRRRLKTTRDSKEK